VWDILATVDLSDCYAWLKEKKQLRQVAPCGPSDAPA
jgi:hypothetical protein